MEELKPCPFCGTEAMKGTTLVNSRQYGIYIGCPACGARSRNIPVDLPQNIMAVNPMETMAAEETAYKAAAALWNMRAKHGK